MSESVTQVLNFISDVLPELIGAGAGVFLGFRYERSKEAERFEKHIQNIAPLVIQELESNIELFRLFERNRDGYWKKRSPHMTIVQETYKEDLWKWGKENNAPFAPILQSLIKLEYYRSRYGDNPKMQSELNDLIILTRKFIEKLPEPFKIEQYSE